MYHVQARAHANSTKFLKTIVHLPDIEAVRYYLENDAHATIVHKPYIFTYLGLSDGTIITQTVDHNGTPIIVSPIKLAEAFNIK